jgi:hypothetical protein
MQDIYSTLIVLHISGGSAGLLAGTVAAITKKGSRQHRLSGKFFFFGMLVASLSAGVLSWLPGHENIFLFAVAGFTFYMICSGYRAIFQKRQSAASGAVTHNWDILITLFGAGFGGFLLYLSLQLLRTVNLFGLVPTVFAMVCLFFSWADLQLILGKTTVKSRWLTNHISRMMGALIASYTAFLVVNVQIRQQWILWLLPSLIGGFFIRYFLRKYTQVKKSN